MTQTQQPTDLRTRTYTWGDPLETAAILGTRSGIDTLRAILAGEVPAPPIMHTLGMDPIEVSDGRVVATLTPREFHYNPLGTVHGGVLATILDTAAACAVHSTLPAGVGYTSLDLNLKFLRAVTEASGQLRCVGTVLQRGRRTALAEAKLTDGAGRLVAHATSSCLLLEMPT
jgi:uncharacterized protein (TIGR00369 family)